MTIHQLLWTSGWDSTFRLLQIILIEKKSVQPIYVIDKTRKSLTVELKGIEKILKKIKELHPEAYQRILPVWYVDEVLTINDKIKESASYINSFIRLGSQYSWLAQFCHNHNLNNVEISNDKNLKANSLTCFLLTNYINADCSNQKNKEKHDKIDVIFKYFSFPVVALSKRDMLNIAKKNKWENIMYSTWFCHKPRKNKACGKCVPCINVIRKQMGFRIPVLNRMKGYFKIYLLEIKSKIN
nr:7-cyano-7-deazaguanine synthase [uncultured Flavobacterium sp.]